MTWLWNVGLRGFCGKRLWTLLFCTMLEPFLVQVRVRGGLPDHLQFRATSESTSTVMGLGSTTSMGPTGKQTSRCYGCFNGCVYRLMLLLNTGIDQTLMNDEPYGWSAVWWSHSQLYRWASQSFQMKMFVVYSSLLFISSGQFNQNGVIGFYWSWHLIWLPSTSGQVRRHIFSSFFFFQFLQRLPTWIMCVRLTLFSACSSFTSNPLCGLPPSCHFRHRHPSTDMFIVHRVYILLVHTGPSPLATKISMHADFPLSASRLVFSQHFSNFHEVANQIYVRK